MFFIFVFFSITIVLAEPITFNSMNVEVPTIFCLGQQYIINLTAYNFNGSTINNLNTIGIGLYPLNSTSYQTQLASYSFDNKYKIPITIMNLTNSSVINYTLEITATQAIASKNQDFNISVIECKNEEESSFFKFVDDNWIIIVGISVIVLIWILILSVWANIQKNGRK